MRAVLFDRERGGYILHPVQVAKYNALLELSREQLAAAIEMNKAIKQQNNKPINTMKKQQIAAGLNGLLTPAPQEPTQATTGAATNGGATRPVSYNLNAELLEKLRYVAFMTHRKNNAVVSEALEKYLTEWEQANGTIKLPQ